jgi:1L-myo-inositol 1-phosphate cytidylyltransferase
MVRDRMASESSNRVGVVLAAGLGTRLATLSDSKPLMQVHHVPLLLRTLTSLELAGCKRVIIVVGHEADTVRGEIEKEYGGPLPLEFVFNPDFQLKNGVSVLCARPHVSDEFVLTMADHIFDDSIMTLVRDHQPAAGGATLCVDYKVDSIFDIDDATKVQAKNGSLVAIHKQLDTYDCIDTGIFVCTPALMDGIEQVYRDTGDASLSDGVARLAAAGTMNILDIGDAFWQDVDTPEMLAHAEEVLSRRAAG